MSNTFFQDREFIYFSGLMEQGCELIKESFPHLSVPGLYGIISLTTNRIFFNESENLIDKISRNYTDLFFNTFDLSAELDLDIRMDSLSSLAFVIIEKGPEWGDLQKRRKELEKLENSGIFELY